MSSQFCRLEVWMGLAGSLSRVSQDPNQRAGQAGFLPGDAGEESTSTLI